MLKYAHIPYILACHLQIDADTEPAPGPTYDFDAVPDADPEPDFYLMRTRIHVIKMMRFRIHNTLIKIGSKPLVRERERRTYPAVKWGG